MNCFEVYGGQDISAWGSSKMNNELENVEEGRVRIVYPHIFLDSSAHHFTGNLNLLGRSTKRKRYGKPILQ